MKDTRGRTMTVIAAVALCGVMAVAAWAVFRPAEAIDIPDEPVYVPAAYVYVTPSGSKYHRRDCQAIAASKRLECLTPEAAQAAGYEPCMLCTP